MSKRPCGARAGLACAVHLCLVQRHDGTVPVRIASLGTFRQRQRLATRATMLVTGSSYSAGQLVHNGFDPARIRIIPPVPAALGQPVALPPGDPRRMLFMGQVVRGKGLDLLLEAAAHLQGEWRLDVAGDGPQLEECRQLATRLGIAARVNFAGWVPHAALHDWIAGAGVVVVPSRWPEPFGMVGIEAMARARAVVAFRSGGIPDWLEDGVTGLLAPAGDAVGLAGCLQHVLDDPATASMLGSAGHRRVATKFRHETFLAGMEAVAGEAVQRHAAT